VFRHGVHLNHFATMLIFALLVSIALASLTQRVPGKRIKYAIRSFVLFIVIGVGIAWLMYPFSR
jgi:hypothetical protein